MPLYKTEYRNSWAIVIGINKYNYVSPLEYARNDAEEVAKVLIEDLGFSEENVIILLDSDATKASIMSSFLSFTKDKVGVDDRILLYYAGHGHTIPGRRSEIGYLIPVDGSLDDLSSFIRWDDLTRNSELIQAKHMLFIMDACYGGLAITRALQPGSTRFLKDMLQRYSRQVLTAGKADEVVSDSGGPIPGHSIFTGHFLEGLQGKAASVDGVITANGIMSYVYEKVSKDLYSKQTPHFGFIDGDGDFIFSAPILETLQNGEGTDTDVLMEIPYSINEDKGLARDNDIVERTKEYLSDARYRIKLDDFVTQEIRRFLYSTSEEIFSLKSSKVTPQDFDERLKKYEAVTHNLQSMVTVLAQWGDDSHIGILKKVLMRMVDNFGPETGTIVWLKLRWYPLTLLMYSVGIGAITSDNYRNLATVFMTKVCLPYKESKEVILPVAEAMAELHDVFKAIPGQERYYTPRSEYMLKSLQPILDDLLFIGKSYEDAFDRFEVFFALVYADLRSQNGNGFWGPPGRFAWKYRNLSGSDVFSRIVKEAEQLRDEWEPLKAGLFGGSFERFNNVAVEFAKFISQLGWF